MENKTIKIEDQKQTTNEKELTAIEGHKVPDNEPIT